MVLAARWVWLRVGDPDFTLEAYNFAVVLVPFSFSVFLAFMPNMRKAHIALRITVILVGVLFSVVVWQQQDLSMKAAKRDQREAIEKAVSAANSHSDEQIAGVKSDVESINGKIEKLPSTISNELQTNTSMLTSAIGKANPYALTRARLEFSLFATDQQEFPLKEMYFPREDDGSVNVRFWVKNVSEDISTGKGDIWIQICGGCSYPKEPPGFVKREGMDEHYRHKMFEFLNAGIPLEPMLLPVKPPLAAKIFQVSFMYSCEMCGKVKDWQTLTVLTRQGPDIHLKGVKP